MPRPALYIAVPLLGISACTGPARSGALEPPPEEITWMGAIALDEAGLRVGATGLQASPDLGPPEGTERAKTMWVVGFTDAELDALGAPAGPSGRAAATLALAGPEDPVLPTAPWRANGPVEGGHARLAATTEVAPELTVAWLPRCPVRIAAPTAAVDATCRLYQCQARASQDGCDLQVDLQSECNLGALRGRIDGRGKLHFDPDPTFDVCSERQGDDPDSETQAVLHCLGPQGSESQGCDIQVFSSTAAPGVRVTRRKLVDGEALAPGFTPRARGYFGALRKVGDALWLTTHDGAPNERCQEREKGRLLVLDPDTLEVTRTLDLPPCPVDIAPLGEDMIVGVGSLGHALVRLGPEGTPRASTALDALSSHQVFRMLVDEAAGLVTVLALALAPDLDDIVLVLDVDTLALVWSHPGRALTDVFSTAPGTISLWNRDREQLETYALPSGELIDAFAAGRCTRSRVTPRRAARIGDVLALTSIDEDASITLVRPGNLDTCQTGIPFGPKVHLFDPVGLLDARYVLMTAGPLDPTASGAALQRFDRVDAGFEPPIDLGYGNPQDAVLVGRRVVVTLPWSGEVVAVDFE